MDKTLAKVEISGHLSISLLTVLTAISTICPMVARDFQPQSGHLGAEMQAVQVSISIA
jgi:hypothetical protein